MVGPIGTDAAPCYSFASCQSQHLGRNPGLPITATVLSIAQHIYDCLFHLKGQRGLELFYQLHKVLLTVECQDASLEAQELLGLEFLDWTGRSESPAPPILECKLHRKGLGAPNIVPKSLAFCLACGSHSTDVLE